MAGQSVLLMTLLLFSAPHFITSSNPEITSSHTNTRSANQQTDTSLTASASYTVDQTSIARDGRVQEARGSVHVENYNPTNTYSTLPQVNNNNNNNNVRSQIRTVPIVKAISRPSVYPSTNPLQTYSPTKQTPVRQRIFKQSPPRPIKYRKPIYYNRYVTNRRQYFEDNLMPYLTVPRPPPPQTAMSKATISSRPPAPHSGHVVYTKPPPEVIYYGPNPPPLDYSPPQHYPVAYRKPMLSRPVVSPPVQYDVPQEPEDHDIMNDLDKYIPDDEAPIKSDDNYSPMSSMMMPLMMLGLTIPALGFAVTYLSRRRRRRDLLGIHPAKEELDRVMNLLNNYIEKSKKET